MHTTGQARAPRTFWWDRAGSVDADPLRAVIFDAEALGELEGEPRAGLIDLVMSLVVAGIWVAVVSTRDRAWAETVVRDLVGEGLVETLVTADDVPDPDDDVELYRLALWELGITPEAALSFTGTGRGLRTAVTAGLPTKIGAGYDSVLAVDCQRLHRQWWNQQRAAAA